MKSIRETLAEAHVNWLEKKSKHSNIIDHYAQALEKDYIRKDSVKWVGERELRIALRNYFKDFKPNGLNEIIVAKEKSIHVLKLNSLASAFSSLAIPEVKLPEKKYPTNALDITEKQHNHVWNKAIDLVKQMNRRENGQNHPKKQKG